MAKNLHKLAQEAFDSGNYQLAVELFEHILQFFDKTSDNVDYAPTNDSLISIDTYIGYGDSLARCGLSRESFNVYAFICNQLGYSMSVDKLKHLTIGLLESFTSSSSKSTKVRHQQRHQQMQTNMHKNQQQLLLQQPSSVSNINNNNNNIINNNSSNNNNTSQENSSSECANINNNSNNCISVNSDFLTNSTNSCLSCDDSTTDLTIDYHRNYRCSDGSDSSSSNCCSNECAVLYEHRCNHINNINNNKSNCNNSKNSMATANYLDPLLCPICEHVFIYPVTMVCGHTYCRECVNNITQCQVCDKRFLVDGDHLKQDVLISRLVEKWWMPHIQAELVNDKTQTLMHQNALDEALKLCNESLEKCKYKIITPQI